MARKKKAIAKKKKSVKDTPKRVIISEWQDWKAGDLVWAKSYPLGKTVYGEIQEFYPIDSVGPAVVILDQVNGCYRTVLCAGMSEEDPRKKRQKNRRAKK